MRPEDRLDVIQRSVVREMARYGREFTIDGSIVRGPGSTAVAVREHPGDGGAAGHVDLGFVLKLGSSDGPVVWDCAAGLGKTEEEKLDNAVRMWGTTTAATMVELMEHRGEHGDHYGSAQPGGVPGWHTVQGPACVFGFENAELSSWLGENHVLPALAEHLPAELSDPNVNGVKLFLGGRAGDDVAEVRVNGEVSAAASAALRTLDWPRGERLSWARLFLLLVADGGPLQTVRSAETPVARAVAPVAADPRPVVETRRSSVLTRWWRARRAGQ